MLLRPGMTATARITTDKKDNVLLVPNTALRFAPSMSGASSSVSMFMMGPPHGSSSSKVSKDVGGAATQRQSNVWVLRNGAAEQVSIVTGSTDGTRTEVISGNLKAGDLVITSQLKAAE